MLAGVARKRLLTHRAAGLDQTRGWFYSLTVLSTILFDKPAFKNLVCNGMVLAEDGKKMSKSLKNYPVSLQAAVIRAILLSSPLALGSLLHATCGRADHERNVSEERAKPILGSVVVLHRSACCLFCLVAIRAWDSSDCRLSHRAILVAQAHSAHKIVITTVIMNGLDFIVRSKDYGARTCHQ